MGSRALTAAQRARRRRWQRRLIRARAAAIAWGLLAGLVVLWALLAAAVGFHH